MTKAELDSLVDTVASYVLLGSDLTPDEVYAITDLSESELRSVCLAVARSVAQNIDDAAAAIAERLTKDTAGQKAARAELDEELAVARLAVSLTRTLNLTRNPNPRTNRK